MTEKTLVINLPHSIKDLIKSTFQQEFSASQIDKINFLVYKINKEKEYQIHIGNHSWALSLNRGSLSNILSTLCNVGIIELTDKYMKGAKSNTYRVINSFSISDNDYKKYYNPTSEVIPKWVEKYIVDNFTVKGKKFSKYIQESPSTPKYTKQQTDNLIKLLELHNIDYSHIIKEVSEVMHECEAFDVKPEVNIKPIETMKKEVLNKKVEFSAPSSIYQKMELEREKRKEQNEDDGISDMMIDQDEYIYDEIDEALNNVEVDKELNKEVVEVEFDFNGQELTADMRYALGGSSLEDIFA